MKKSLGIMLDCSRDAVLKPEKVKEFAKLISDMGYNMLQLYTEDTYEMDGEPFWGYMRGRYTKEELKDIDAYCQSVGVELVPCIQVLAHLNQVKRWKDYREMFDCNDILLVGEEKVYELIDKMFATVGECFQSKRVNVGMDEAFFLGRGRYQDLNGAKERVEILAEHLKRVKEIADRHGVSIMMWSDMFIRLHNNGKYYGENLRIPKETIDSVPEGIELIYWDYYSTETNRYDQMFRTHSDFNNPIAFAGGMWTWIGFTPHLSYTLDATEAAMRSVEKFDLKTVFFTMWGDNGKECSFFNMLPTLFAASRMYKGIYDRQQIAKEFEEIYGYSYEEFMKLELADMTDEVKSHQNNPAKYMLYNDLFLGLYDFTVSEEMAGRYKDAAEQLKMIPRGRVYDYLFDVQQYLLEVLAQKSDIGIKIRKAYDAKDKETLAKIANEELPSLIAKVRTFGETFRKMWLKENKAFGLEVHEQRIGGLIYRMECCVQRLQGYLTGELNQIDELELTTETFLEKEEGRAILANHWNEMVTTSII